MPDLEVDPGPVLIAGPVTWDLIRGQRVPGGSVSYAARTCAALGVRAHVLTTASRDVSLEALAGHEVHVVPSPHTLAYEHEEVDGVRRLRLGAHPGRTLSAEDIPASWPRFGTAILAPLIEGDVDVPALAKRCPAGETAILAQGLQRRAAVGEFVRVIDRPAPALLVAAQDASVFLSSDEVARWPAAGLEALRGVVRRLVVTDGARGAEVYADGRITRVEPVATQPADTTGAGDVFATAFILAVRAGVGIAGRLAAAYAAANVERAGPVPLPSRAQVAAHYGVPGPHGGASGEGHRA